MEQFTSITAIAAPLLRINIDTDAIIPSREMRTVGKTGLARGMFAGWRYKAPGSREENPDFVLNREPYRQARILLSGANFGCGSSREHAPWALVGYGFRAVVSTFFADIFRNNALKNGLLPIVVDPQTHRRLQARLEADPDARLTVDLASQTLTLPDGGKVEFPIDPFAKHCLLNGVDQLGFLLGEGEAIAAYEATHPARVHTHA